MTTTFFLRLFHSSKLSSPQPPPSSSSFFFVTVPSGFTTVSALPPPLIATSIGTLPFWSEVVWLPISGREVGVGAEVVSEGTECDGSVEVVVREG